MYISQYYRPVKLQYACHLSIFLCVCHQLNYCVFHSIHISININSNINRYRCQTVYYHIISNNIYTDLMTNHSIYLWKMDKRKWLNVGSRMDFVGLCGISPISPKCTKYYSRELYLVACIRALLCSASPHSSTPFHEIRSIFALWTF